MNFIALDFERLNYSRESAWSVGLVKFVNGKAVDDFYSLIHPPILSIIRPEFIDIHGIIVEDIREAPSFAALWESAIRSFIGDLPLAAHNAFFHMGIFSAFLDWHDIPIPPFKYFCTLKLVGAAWPELKSHSNTSLRRHFGITYNARNALEGAQTCGIIVYKAAEKYGCTHLRDLLRAVKIKMNNFQKSF